MSMSEKIQQRRLSELESEFEPLLIESLQQCSRGRWGLFDTYTNLEASGQRWDLWPEARHVKELAEEIRELHGRFGSSNWLAENLLRICALTRSYRQNTQGDPKLAAEFLEDIERKSRTNTAV